MTTAFTPGPWHVGAMNDALFVINEPPRPAPVDYINDKLTTKCVATPNSIEFPYEEAHANAHLIAAAPSLYEALERTIYHPLFGTTDRRIERQFWIDEKAEGREEADDRIFALDALDKADGKKL